MLFPPSLSAEVLERSFRSGSGELGVLPTDTEAFLGACEADQIEVLGWELWLVDHRFDFESGGPKQADGFWCGLVPTLEGDLPAVIAGEGDARQTRTDIAALNLSAVVKHQWLRYARFNFTIRV